MAYGDFKDLIRRIVPDKIFCEKAFDNAKNPKHDRYHRGLASVVYNFFDKKTALLADKSAPVVVLRKEKYSHLLQTKFGMLILLICN